MEIVIFIVNVRRLCTIILYLCMTHNAITLYDMQLLYSWYNWSPLVKLIVYITCTNHTFYRISTRDWNFHTSLHVPTPKPYKLCLKYVHRCSKSVACYMKLSLTFITCMNVRPSSCIYHVCDMNINMTITYMSKMNGLHPYMRDA